MSPSEQRVKTQQEQALNHVFGDYPFKASDIELLKKIPIMNWIYYENFINWGVDLKSLIKSEVDLERVELKEKESLKELVKSFHDYLTPKESKELSQLLGQISKFRHKKDNKEIQPGEMEKID